MSSRRSGKTGRTLFEPGGEMSFQEAASVVYGDSEMLAALDRQHVVTRAVDLQEITIDVSIQVRTGGLDPERVEMLKQVLLNGGAFKDPIQLIDDGEQLLLADGLHRVEATMQALGDSRVVNGEIMIASLQAEIRIGTFEDALNLSEEANLKHGAPLSNEDKKNLLWRRLERGYYDANVSSRVIAKTLGVDHTTIGRWRDQWKNIGGANATVGEKKGKRNKASKRQPTQLQLRQRTLKSLRVAADSMNKLGMNEGEEILRFVESLAQKWNIG